MSFMRAGFAGEGYPVMSFDYPYQEAGRRSPDARSRLDACHLAAAVRLGGYVEHVVWAGKSMGGRIATHLVADGAPAAAVVVFGYPLLPPGKTEPRDTDHFATIRAPVLLVQGTRDRLAPLEALEPRLGDLAHGEIALVEDGDHSLRVPKRTGLTEADVWGSVVAIVCSWLQDALPDQS